MYWNDPGGQRNACGRDHAQCCQRLFGGYQILSRGGLGGGSSDDQRRCAGGDGEDFLAGGAGCDPVRRHRDKRRKAWAAAAESGGCGHGRAADRHSEAEGGNQRA